MKRIVFAIMTIIVISCTKTNEDIDIIDTPVKEYSVQEKTELISSYAQMLAASLHNPELRSTIKKEAQLKFDGDYDVLTSKLNDIRLSDNNMTIRHILSNTCIMTRSNESGFKGNLEELVAEIQTTFPNLQVAVPVHCDEWDTENYIPLVAFLPYDYIDQVTPEVQAFDEHGNTYSLSTKEDPERPVIVVSISERVDEEGKFWYDEDIDQQIDVIERNVETKSSSYPSDLKVDYAGSCGLELSWNNVSDNKGYEIYRRRADESYYTKISQTSQDVNTYTNTSLASGTKYYYKVRAILASGYSAFSNIVNKYAAQRYDGAAINVTKMRFTSRKALRSVEDWVSGAPELTLRIYSGIGTPSMLNIHKKFEPPTRDDILTLVENGETDWWNKSLTAAAYWYYDTIGPVLTFDWREEDYNREEDITIYPYIYDKETDSLESGNYSITIKADNGVDHIGTSVVHFWDSKNTIYELSGFQWMCN